MRLSATQSRDFIHVPAGAAREFAPAAITLTYAQAAVRVDELRRFSMLPRAMAAATASLLRSTIALISSCICWP